MKCSECRAKTGGCKNGTHFKESQGCFGPKQKTTRKRYTPKDRNLQEEE